MYKLPAFLCLVSIVSFCHGQNKALEHELVRLDSQKVMLGQEAYKSALHVLIGRCQTKKDRETEANTRRRLGVVYSRGGKLDSAIFQLVEAARLQEITGNKIGRASTLNNVAYVYYALHQLPKALTTYREMLELVEDSEGADAKFSGQLLIVGYQNSAQLYFELDSLEQAHTCIGKALESMDAVNKEDDGSVIHFRGLIELEQKKYKEALQSFAKAQQLFSANKVRTGVVQSIHNQALCLQGLKEWNSANLYFNSAFDSALVMEDPVLITEIADDFQQFWLDQGDTFQAYHYLDISKRLQDSLLNQAGIEALIDAEQKYAGEAKTREIQAQKKALQQRQLLIAGLLILLGLILAVFVLYRRLSLQKQRLAAVRLREKSLEVDDLLRKQELNSLNAQVQGQNEERQRISRDLHDRLGSLLSTIKLQFSHFEGRLSEIEVQFRNTYHGMLGMIDKAYEEVRRISHDLSSGTLERFGLKKAVQELIDAITEVNEMEIHFIDNRTDPALYAKIGEPLYRIIQELLGNTLKHARATEVNMQLRVSGGVLYFSYEDNGTGFRTEELEKSGGIGMRNIDTRVNMLNGTYNLDSTPGHGMTVMIEIPL